MSSLPIRLAAFAAVLLAVAGTVFYLAPEKVIHAPKAVTKLIKKHRATVLDWPARVSSLAGSGEVGASDGVAPFASFADPFGVVLDRDGNLYLADAGESNRIRKVAVDGSVSTLAGSVEGFADGTGAAARFNTPSGMAIDSAGNLYVADTANNAIRKVTPAGVVSTLAGDGTPGYADGKGGAARFNGPIGLAVATDGSLFVADTYNDRIRRVAQDGTVSTVAGAGLPGDVDGPALRARFDTPCGLAFDGAGELWIADSGNDAIRKLGQDGQIVTLARAAENERDALVRLPMALAFTRDDYAYVLARGRVLQIAPGGQPRGIAVAADGTLRVTDPGVYGVLRLAPPEPDQPALALRIPAPPLRTTPMLWPVKPQDQVHEVVGLMGEVRGNYDGESRDHLHGGLDIQAGIGAPVLTVEAAKVGNPLPNWGFGELSEGLNLGVMSYIHMRVGRSSKDKPFDARFQLLLNEAGKPQRVRVKRGVRFGVGETIGTVNRMAHVHLAYSPVGGERNPLALPFIGMQDTIAPLIQSINLLYGSGHSLKTMRAGRVVVPRAVGQVEVAVEAYDQIDGNLARRRLGLYRLGYQLLQADGRPAPGFAQPRMTQLYDHMPQDREAVKVMYADSSGITAHGAKSTRFVYAASNTLVAGKVARGGWEPGSMAPGDYVLRVIAADYAGNQASANRDLLVTLE